MVNKENGLDKLEIAVHTIFVLFGIIILGIAYTQIKDPFWGGLLVNIGSSLIVVTILFAIFEIFRREYDNKHENLRRYVEEEVKAQLAKTNLTAMQVPPSATPPKPGDPNA
ncbi:hypothetical protein [Pantanalinema sp. GBBB05]|uniref:hypothetical protein n=1 Tax=Pantanalinema sp. GBBB05 TaxID=2604139 RepID=UPI001DA6774A|nr:hypothetical protein [Pantanalinema sp. GBBB05]